jgi:hypothetical protein
MELVWPPWLRVAGIEIANAARTFRYLERGLGGQNWHVQEPSQQVMPLLYRLAGLSDFVSPAVDPAPWYDPDHPESAEFLGIVLERPTAFDSTQTREFDAIGSGLGGAAFGRQITGPRPFVFNGTLVASTPAGREWGRRWLANILAASCDPCMLAQMEMYAYAPDGDDDTEGRWIFYDVAQTTGFQEQDAPMVADWLDATFTITAGNPALYEAPELLYPAAVLDPSASRDDCMRFDDWLVGPPGPLHEIPLSPPAFGTLGVVITIDAPGGVNGTLVSTYLDDPLEPDVVPEHSILVGRLPAGSSLEIDSAKQRVTYTAPNGEEMDGAALLALEEGVTVPWTTLTRQFCDPPVWIGVQTPHPYAHGDQATVTIEQAVRAL